MTWNWNFDKPPWNVVEIKKGDVNTCRCLNSEKHGQNKLDVDSLDTGGDSVPLLLRFRWSPVPHHRYFSFVIIFLVLNTQPKKIRSTFWWNSVSGQTFPFAAVMWVFFRFCSPKLCCVFVARNSQCVARTRATCGSLVCSVSVVDWDRLVKLRKREKDCGSNFGRKFTTSSHPVCISPCTCLHTNRKAGVDQEHVSDHSSFLHANTLRAEPWQGATCKRSSGQKWDIALALWKQSLLQRVYWQNLLVHGWNIATSKGLKIVRVDLETTITGCCTFNLCIECGWAQRVSQNMQLSSSQLKHCPQSFTT